MQKNMLTEEDLQNISLTVTEAISGAVETLHANMEEIKVRLTKIEDRITDLASDFYDFKEFIMKDITKLQRRVDRIEQPFMVRDADEVIE